MTPLKRRRHSTEAEKPRRGPTEDHPEPTDPDLLAAKQAELDRIPLRGAWVRHYAYGLTGTLNNDLHLEADVAGWSIRAWKEEVVYAGFGRGIHYLGSPEHGGEHFGDALRERVHDLQGHFGLPQTGVIDRLTGEAILRARCQQLDADRAPGAVYGMVAHESAFDVGAIGQDDPLDRGAAQIHLYPNSYALSQVIRPVYALRVLRDHVNRVTREFDAETAVASWNVGEGGAHWWWAEGKPATGSPDWWQGAQPLAERATEYVEAVRQFRPPWIS